MTHTDTQDTQGTPAEPMYMHHKAGWVEPLSALLACDCGDDLDEYIAAGYLVEVRPTITSAEREEYGDWIEVDKLCTRYISLDNGKHFCDADSVPAAAYELWERSVPAAAYDELWERIVSAMDDATREAVHADIAPCSNRNFLAEYLRRATDDLVIG